METSPLLHLQALGLGQLQHGVAGDARQDGAAQGRGHDLAVDHEEHVHGADLFHVLALHGVQPQHLGIALLLGQGAASMEAA